MPAATLTFKLSVLEASPGIYNSTSALLLTCHRKPSPSLPSARMQGDSCKGLPISSVDTDFEDIVFASNEGATAANTFQPARWDSIKKFAGLLIENRETFSDAPALALSTTGVNEALFRAEIATAETPKNCAVLSMPPFEFQVSCGHQDGKELRNVPRFPGSRIPSSRSTRGIFPNGDFMG